MMGRSKGLVHVPVGVSHLDLGDLWPCLHALA